MIESLIASTILLGLGQTAYADDTPPVAINDANVTATDALGRTLPSFDQTGPPKPNRWVGLFYWQWHGDDRWGKDYNMTEFLKTHPRFMDFTATPPGGPNNPTWYWGEPLFGYYRSTDPWVIRKHLALLSHAGLDFLFLDYTNDAVYDPELKTFLDVAREMKSKGLAVPRLVFFLNSDPNWKAESLYTKWYKPGKYDDMWFRWHGKPLIMAPRPTGKDGFKDPTLLAEVQDFFTWRQTWALFDTAQDPHKWRFMDTLQADGKPRAALGPDGQPEQIVVNKSMGGPIWDNMKSGGVSTYPGHVPTYNDQWLSGEESKGLFFQHSWDAALAQPAPILLVTGWNEWKASVWEDPGVTMLGRRTVKGQGFIVDEFNMDFNRDIEPMRGGYGDNFLYQFLANMRMYKGMNPPTDANLSSNPRETQPRGAGASPASGYPSPMARVKLTIDSPLRQWDRVLPVFHHADGATSSRDWNGTVPGSHYQDSSARNNIVSARVAYDDRNVYFQAHTSAPLTDPTGQNWMVLLIDVDHNAATGWNGYDLLVDRSRSGGKCSIEANVGGGWYWKHIADAAWRRTGNDLLISIPRRALGLVDRRKPVSFDFKWTDNLPETPNVADLYTKGDSAPEGRMSYRYVGRDVGH